MENQLSQNQENVVPNFRVDKIHTKSLSFETFDILTVLAQGWKPDAKIELQIGANSMANSTYEVKLTAKVNVKSEGNDAFIVKLEQAGIFTLLSFTKEQMEAILNVTCPHLIYPYLAEVVSNVAVRGGFPPIHLGPMNFEALFAERKKQSLSNEN